MSEESDTLCPITHDEIQDAVMTLYGGPYERKAIAEWLTDNHIDPMTGLVLPNKELTSVNIKDPILIKKAKEVCAEAISTRDPDSHIRIKSWHLRQKLKKETALFDGTTPEWTRYNESKRAEFKNTDSQDCAYMHNPWSDDIAKHADKREKIKRPTVGRWYDFTDLSGIRVDDKALKSERFYKTNLSGATFCGCQMGHVEFLEANLKGCIFIDCTFIGDYTFSGSESDDRTMFIDCQFERLYVWRTVQIVDEAAKNLKIRGLSININQVYFHANEKLINHKNILLTNINARGDKKRTYSPNDYYQDILDAYKRLGPIDITTL